MITARIKNTQERVMSNLLELKSTAKIKEADFERAQTLLKVIQAECADFEAIAIESFDVNATIAAAQMKILNVILSQLDEIIEIINKPVEKMRQANLIQAYNATQELPLAISKSIGNCAPLEDKSVLKVEVLNDLEIADKLALNAGNPEELKALIEKNPHLLFKVSEATNSAGMRVKGTLYQKALGSNDFEIADMLQKLLLAYDPEAEKKQRTDQFPLGWGDGAKNTLNQLLAMIDDVLDKVINAGSVDVANEKKELDTAFDNFKRFIVTQNEKVLTTGIYSNLELLMEADRRLEENIKKVKDYTPKKNGNEITSQGYWSVKASLYQQKVYGLIQAKMMAPRDANEILRGVIKFDESKPAPRNLNVSGGFSYYSQTENGLKLGDHLYIDMFGLPQVSALQMGHGIESNPNQYYEKLCEARTRARNTLCDEERINKLRKEIPLKKLPPFILTGDAPKKLEEGILLVSEEAKKGVSTFGTFSPKVFV